MKSMIDKIKELKDKSIVKKMLVVAEIAFYLYFFLKMCLNLCYGTEAEFQVIRDYYNFKAICYLLGIIIVATRAHIWHWICLLAAGGYAAGCIFYMKKMMFESELFQAMEMRLIAYGLCGIILIDAIIRKNFVKLKNRNWWLTGILMFAFIFTWIFSIGRANTFCFLCPFAVIYLIKLTPQVWVKLMNCFSVSFVGSVCWIFGKSLMEVPYEGSRYWGVFLNLSTIGLFCAGATVCAMYWFLVKREGRWRWSWRFVPILGALAFSLTAVSMISARTAMLALICVVFFAFVCCPADQKPGTMKKRFLIICITACVLLVAGFCVLWGMYQVDRETLRALIPNDMIYNKVAYWHGRASTMFRAESRMFEHGTPIAMLDRFSSGRLGIWYNYLTNLNWFGHLSTYLEEVKPHRLHAHNSYISNLYNYGIIGGGAYLCWNIGLFVTAIKKAASDNKIYLLPVLWIALALGGMLTDMYHWIYPIPFIMLLMQYPLLVKIEKNEKEKK